MDRKSGVRKILVASLLLIVFATVFIVSMPTQDVVAASSSCTYYSNASHTTIVGQFGYDCCNNAVHWGVKTAYKVCGGCFPCFPPPR